MPDSSFIDLEPVPLPFEVAERERLRAEREQARRWRYDMTTGRKKHGASHPSGTTGYDNRVPYMEYPFLAFDGEATTEHGFCLFGTSDGNDICDPSLTTEDCLEYILAKKREYPKSILIIFGGRYDFDEIIRKSMPWRRISQLKNFGAVLWHGFKIKQAEGKFTEIAKDGITARVFEIHGWFHCSYEKALAKYKVPMTGRDKDLIHEGKAARGTFEWADIQNVRKYMHAELRYMPVLMDQVREICHSAGFRPRSWYGPSALATELLTRHKIKNFMGVPPDAVNLAAQFGYAGGRFEMPRGGIINTPIYSYDWNSAYMTAALELPCLAHGRWRHGKGKFEPGKFGIYRIKYYETDSSGYPVTIDNRRIYPLFRRYPNGSVLFGNRTQGWYWAPEADLVRDSPHATFLESWIWDAECTHQPFAFVREVYDRRMVLERLGPDHPSYAAAQAFKWALASIYGQLVRSVGWDKWRKLPPRYHQLEWGGYITSRCRAEMYRLAKLCGDKLLSIDTDSVTAMCPIPLEKHKIGKALGQWKLSTADGGIFFQNGIYCTHVSGDWSFKQRGIAEESRIDRSITPTLSPELLSRAIESGLAVELRPKSRYVTLRMALNNRTQDAGNWETDPSDKLYFGGGGKRYHNLRSCHHTCSKDGVHLFLHNTPLPTRDSIMTQNIDSVRYPLPWKDQVNPIDQKLIADIVWVDPEKIDDEDAWLVRLIEPEMKSRIARGAAITAGAR